MHMSNIAKHLRALASATRVSMEADVDPAVQGQEDNIDKELAEIAAKAASEEEQGTDDAAVDTAQTSEEVPTTDAPTDAAPAEGGEEAAAAADALDPPTDGAPPAEGDVPDADEPSADEIETPAESDLKTALTEQAQQQADSEAQAVDGESEQPEGSTALEPEGAEDATATPTDGEQSQPVENAGDETGAPPTETPTTAEVAPEATGAASEFNAEGELDPGGFTLDGDDAGGNGEVLPEAGSETVTPSEVAPAETTTDEVPTATDSTPAPAETTPEQSVQNDEKPAAPPGPQTETSEAVQEVVELTEALAAAQSAEDVVKKAREVAGGLEDAAGVAQVLNEQGGVSVESFCLLQMSLRPHLAQVERPFIDLGVTMENYKDDPKAKFEVSLEELFDIINDLEHAEPVLERQSIEALDRTVCALKDAIPSACDRLKAVISKASLADDNSYGHSSVDVSDGLNSALLFDRSQPENLADDLQVYAQLGRQLLGEYSEKANNGAKAASLINNAVNFNSDSGFWEKIGAAVEAVQDPRHVLGESNLLMSLPGGSHLFGERGRGFTSGNETLLKLIAYTDDYAPMEVTVAGKADASVTTFPAFSASKIQLVGRALQEVLDCEHICKRLDEAQKIWPEAADSVRHLRENLENAPGTLDYNTTQHFPQIVKFVETSYSLATWPLINYLANFVLTVNAFVLFAERSLTAPAARAFDAPEEAAVPTEAVEVASDEVAATPAAEEPPAVEGETVSLSKPATVEEPKV